MRTIKDLKNDLVDHLMNIDKTKLSMMDLKTYGEIVRLVDEMDKPDLSERWADMLKTVNTGFGGYYHPVEMKEAQ